MASEASEVELRYACFAGAARTRFTPAPDAIDALLETGLCAPGDHVLAWMSGLERDCSRTLCTTVDAPTVKVFTASAGRASTGSGRMWWLVAMLDAAELRVPDIRALACAAHAAGALLVVDITEATPFGCQPFPLGADACIERLDRFVAPELEKTLFAVSVAPPARLSRRRACREADVPCVSAGVDGLQRQVLVDKVALRDDAGVISTKALALIADGLDSLPARMQRRFDHARALAEYLSCCDVVPTVRYPGLASHADHALVATVLRHGAGAGLAFELPSQVTAGALLDALRVVRVAGGEVAPDAGDATCAAAVRGGKGHDIYLAVGLDNPLTIADDLDQALRWFCNPPEP